MAVLLNKRIDRVWIFVQWFANGDIRAPYYEIELGRERSAIVIPAQRGSRMAEMTGGSGRICFGIHGDCASVIGCRFFLAAVEVVIGSHRGVDDDALGRIPNDLFERIDHAGKTGRFGIVGRAIESKRHGAGDVPEE